jgi:hypothetical protein
MVRTGNWDENERRVQARRLSQAATAAGTQAVRPLVDTLQLRVSDFHLPDIVVGSLFEIQGGEAVPHLLDVIDSILLGKHNMPLDTTETLVRRYVQFIANAPESLRASDSTYLRMTEFSHQAVRRLGIQLLAHSTSEAARRLFSGALERADLWTVAHGASWYIRQGDPMSEPTLERALHVAGDHTTAHHFLNSGNPRLVSAAEAWAKKHNYRILPGFPARNSGDQAKWGSATKGK